MAEPLTLKALGVDTDELPARIAAAQAAAQLTDDDAAALAGVTVRRWRDWIDGIEVPGVARSPRLALALGLSVPALLFGIGADSVAPAAPDPLELARASARITRDLAESIDILRRLAREAQTYRVPIVGGEAIRAELHDIGRIVLEHDAEHYG